MAKRPSVTCADCYFRRAGLCALPGDDPCPTFRQYVRSGLEPPRQPSLLPRAVAAQSAA